ncbi:hypothetical protein ACFPYJ_05485 [Paenibacillus solisilvae]|uniref:Methyltransferase domain-containing protein n=1 Tax=Paenibacillus solisilvae TaxID=2486751 RepID=A0ABW0VRV4_9BACL
MAIEIQKHGAYVMGIDNSNEMLEQARKKYPELQTQLVDALKTSIMIIVLMQYFPMQLYIG